MRPLRPTVVALAVCLAVTGCSGSSPVATNDGVTAQTPDETTTPVSPSTSAAPRPTAVATSAAPSPSPTASRKPLPPPYDVKAVQTRLTELKYYVAAIDGERGGALRSAVMAFQKVNGLSADGSVGKATLAALKAPKTPVLRGSGGGTRIEADLTKQVIYIIRDGKVARIMPTSSGNGKKYATKSGFLATALSPVGYYRIERRIVGERKADLGTLYDPQYFYRGWAIHGSNSVPARPASHGCLRVTRTDAKYLLSAISVGTSLYIYGGAYTFTAGSSAPGTDDPGGDVETPAPSPTPTPVKPSPTPAPSPSPKPTATPKPSASPSPTGAPQPTVLPTP